MKGTLGEAPRASSGAASTSSGMRAAIAAAMARSKREVPHYYLSTTIDLSAATEWLRVRNEGLPPGERLVEGALLLKAVALALRRFPDLNAFWEEGGAKPQSHVHLGVAVSLRGGGLLAPAIHDADQLELGVLMLRLADLVERTRQGKIRSSELTGGTITVTSLGERGVEFVLPIIVPPQVAIVGFGKIVERPWVRDGKVVASPLVTMTLAADHRVSDGHRGGRFLSSVDKLLQKPGEL